MDRNNLYRKISIALDLKDYDLKRLLGIGGMPVSKSAAQDMKRSFRPDDPTRSRRVYEEHLLALLVGLEDEAGNGSLPIEPADSLMGVVQGIRLAISAGEPWPFYGRELEKIMEAEVIRHRGPQE